MVVFDKTTRGFRLHEDACGILGPGMTWGRESRRLNRHSPVSVAGLVAGGDEKTNVPLTTGLPTAGPRDWHGPSQPPRLASPNGREGRRGDHGRAESTTRCEARHGQERVKHRN